MQDKNWHLWPFPPLNFVKYSFLNTEAIDFKKDIQIDRSDFLR